ncbi:MAG: GNAT family N-acetyltransferase, partial [Candidatus Kariarchaeaceae archaeon]
LYYTFILTWETHGWIESPQEKIYNREIILQGYQLIHFVNSWILKVKNYNCDIYYMELRQLNKSEFHKFKDIDRRETVEQIYYHRDGKLELEDEYHDVPEWTPSMKQEFIDSFVELDHRGGFVFGVFDGDKVVGMGSLDVKFIGKNKDQLQLAGLWVSIQYRKKGVAGRLVEHIQNKARDLGAKKLYVSATPSLNTITFYQNRGFKLTKDVNQELFEKEPEDIHMELTL